MTYENKTIILLMAAGKSTRFGLDKKWQEYKNGISIFNQTYTNVKKTDCDFRVIIRNEDSSKFSHLDQETLIVARNADLGLGASISEAISLIQNQYDFCLIALADMPNVKTETYLALISAIQNSPYLAVAPVSNNSSKRGNPVIITKQLYPEFLSLDSDKGGSTIINVLGRRLLLLPVDDQGIYFDIDTPADLSK